VRTELHTGWPCHATLTLSAHTDGDKSPAIQRAKIFGQRAENLANVPIGTAILASGKLSLNSWTDKSGNQRCDWKITVNYVINGLLIIMWGLLPVQLVQHWRGKRESVRTVSRIGVGAGLLALVVAAIQWATS